MRQAGECDAGIIRAAMTDMIQAEPLAKIDYISIADTVALKELGKIRARALVSLAVYIGKTRLIDNIAL
jgi:pantoate--beta-alanine ligase